MKTPEKSNLGDTGERNRRGIFDKFSHDALVYLSLLVNNASDWFPRLKKDDLRQLIPLILAGMTAACQPTRGFEDQPPPSPTPIVEPYHPQPTPELSPISPLELTPTSEPTPMATPGPTISGETLTISDSQLELKEFDGEEIAQLINASEKGWQVITNDKGKVSFFSGEVGKEAQIVVLAQGPEEYQFDYKNQLWRGENNQVFIPDILLPSGWNEAGIFFLIKDIKDNGNYRIGAIYPPDKDAQISDKSNLEILPDGSGLYVGSPKNYQLQEGQQMIRDEDGNLRLTNPDGSYLRMRTSWSQVASPNQLYQAGAFAGPFETQPTLPYPTDEIVQELGITNYQVVDNHYIALHEVVDQQTGEAHQYIVAQVITNKEEKFRGWQRTLPFDVESGLVVPHPQETNPELFDLKKSDAPIPQFVNALEMGGIEVKPEEILANITYEHRQYSVLDEQGKPVMKEYVFAVWNLPEELLPEKFRNVAGPIPLMRAERNQNGEWRWYNNEVAGVVPLRLFADAINLRISVLGSEPYFTDPRYFQVFNTIYNSYFNWSMIERTRGVFSPRRNYLNLVNQSAKSNHIDHITGGHLIYSKQYPEWLKQTNLTPEEAEQIVREHINSVIQRYPNVEIWDVLNEYRSPWIKEDVLDKVLGDQLPMIAFEEARKANPNAFLILSNAQNHFLSRPNVNSLIDRELQLAKKLKQQEIIDGIGLHMHLDKNKWEPIPSPDEFSRVLELCRQAGLKVYITEMDVDLQEAAGRYNFPEDQRFVFQAWVYKNIIKKYLDANIGNYINLWGLRDDTSWLETKLGQVNADPLLFDDSGRPKLGYYAILSLLYDLANQGRVLTP